MRHLVPWLTATTIRVVLSLAISHHWPIRQLDVNNAFFMAIYKKVFT